MKNYREFQYIEVTQPIGTFYISKMDAKDIINLTTTNQRKVDESNGIQREASSNRVKQIEEYTNDPDATFPTPIIISLEKGNENLEWDIENHKIILKDEFEGTIGEIIDGQHRILGLSNSKFIDEFELPVVFMYDLTAQEKAYIFSIINSTQTKVAKSLIYDLFNLFEDRSPFKTCHYLSRSFNSDKNSAYYNRLKMLGKKYDKDKKNLSLSQGTFVEHVIKLISKDPQQDTINIKNNVPLDLNDNYPFRNYFINNKDEVIYKILSNCFNAIKIVFPEQWEDSEKFILSKSTGFGAIIKSLKVIFYLGQYDGNLMQLRFENIFKELKKYITANNTDFVSQDFSSNEQTQSELSRIILRPVIKFIANTIEIELKKINNGEIKSNKKFSKLLEIFISKYEIIKSGKMEDKYLDGIKKIQKCYKSDEDKIVDLPFNIDLNEIINKISEYSDKTISI